MRNRDVLVLLAMYTGAAVVAMLMLAFVISFTVVPMVENYRDHGSIFLKGQP